MNSMRGRTAIFIMTAMIAIGAATAQSPSEIARRREAVREVAQRSERGDSEAMYQMALLHERGYDSIARDTVEALRLLRRSAEKGYAPAENLLGFKLITGEGGAERNPAEGLEYIERAAEAGEPKALSNIGYLLLYGEGIEHDAGKAAYWLQRASDAGNLSATSMLGDLYRDGEGVERDSLKAESLYRLAFDKGLTDAGYKLYEMEREEIDGMGAAGRLREGIYYFRRSTPAVGVEIIRKLADSELNDEGGDAAGTTKEIRAKAKALMGDAYSRGRGVDYDYNLSTRYYLEAAREGDPSAQFVIGEMLEIFPDALEGMIGEEDPDEMRHASYWLERASEGGIESAEAAMRRLFQSAEAIEKLKVES